MKRIVILLLVVLFSVHVFSQKNFIYYNDDLNLEVLFPSEPKVTVNSNSNISITTAQLVLDSYGVSYTLMITKSPAAGEILKTYKDIPGSTLKSSYKVGKKKVMEYDLASGENHTLFKLISYNDIFIEMIAGGKKEKDKYPFYNSIKIDDIQIINPSSDNNKYIDYALEKITNSKTDTIKQIVYVNTGTKNSYQYEKLSDVDKDIPHNPNKNPYRFALIIGNEDYSSHQVDLSSEINVDFARNDASAFKEYALSVLGIPDKNIVFLLDATTGQMNQGISKLNLILKNTQGNAEIFVYYAGHGLPDEQTKEAYIIPVDVSGKNANEGIKLKDMYSKLIEFPSKRVTVFIDACFSGGARNQGLLAARGVKIKPKEDVLNGNLIVFSASSGEQSSLPYKEKQHGFFTYYLLKKMQESKGDVNYKELADFIKEKVSLQSVLVNDKEQSPQVNVSNSMINDWDKIILK